MKAIEIYVEIKKQDARINAFEKRISALYSDRSGVIIALFYLPSSDNNDTATREIEKRDNGESYDLDYVVAAWDAIALELKNVRHNMKLAKVKRDKLVKEFNDIHFDRTEQDDLLQMCCAMEYGL